MMIVPIYAKVSIIMKHYPITHKRQCTLKNDIHRIIKVAFFTKFDIVGNSNYKGYTYLKTLLSQHLEDIGDRELEKFLAENTIAK
jgi:hypothetical protein